MKKTVLIRVAVVAAYLLLAVAAFCTGRTHTVLLDNEAQEGAPAVDEMTLTLGKDESVDFYEGDRDKFTVRGQSATLLVEFPEDADREAQKFRLKIPLADDIVLVSVPKLLAGHTDAVSKFVPEE